MFMPFAAYQGDNKSSIVTLIACVRSFEGHFPPTGFSIDIIFLVLFFTFSLL